MIHILHGRRETVDYDRYASFLMYDNSEYEHYPAHWHIPAEIIMPLENWYDVECAGVRRRLMEGDALIISPGTLHRLIAPKRGRRIIFQVDLSFLNNMPGAEFILPLITPALRVDPKSAPGVHSAVRAAMERIYKEYFGTGATRELNICVELIQMLAAVGKALTAERIPPSCGSALSNDAPEQFAAIFDYINIHYSENVTLEFMADMAGFSKYYFARLFKRVTKQSFYQYLTNARISSAALLLRDPALSVAEVATRCGFSTLSAFLRMFKLHKKCTPTEYRKTRAGYDARQ